MSILKLKNIKIALAVAALAGLTVGCGDKSAASNEVAPQAQKQELKELTIAATATPHAEILNAVVDDLKAQGIELKVTVFDDYVQPNMVVDRGDITANYFQHEPYLQSFNKEKGTKLVTVGRIHYEPFGIYPGISKSLDAIPEEATIAIPNDTTNEARALLLLQDNGLLKLREGAGLTATIQDIVENPHKIKFAEIEAAQIARTRNEFNFVVLNGNYALAAGYNVSRDAIAYEKSDSEAAKTYVNIVVVKAGNENLPEVQALVKELKSEKVVKFIKDKYNGAVVPFDEAVTIPATAEDAAKTEAPKTEAPAATEAPKAEEPKTEAPAATEAPKAEEQKAA